MTLGEKQVPATERLRIFVRYASERKCVVRSLKVALIVGTVLGFINHYDAILSGTLGAAGLLKILLTYSVPYSVATFGSASQAVQMELSTTPRSAQTLVVEGRF